MTKLKLGPIVDNKPVKFALELPATAHRDLAAYAEVLSRTSGQPAPDPAKLIVPMIERFMATDRAFAKVRRNVIQSRGGKGQYFRVTLAKHVEEGAQRRVAFAWRQ